MKRLLAVSSVLLCASVVLGQKGDEPLIEPEKIRAVVREAAAKVEAKFKGIHAEADGLVQTVEDILARPGSRKTDGDRNQQRAAAMRFMSMNWSTSSTLDSVRGYVFDNSLPGLRQRYAELEQATDDGDVRRWLEMLYAAYKLGWKEKEKVCEQRALGAARAWVVREPKNAEAHALLAEALPPDDRREQLAALQTALKLDPQQPRALHLMLKKRIWQALETAVLRREAALDETTYVNAERLLFDKPLTEEEALVLGKKQEKLKREAGQSLKVALELRDLAAYLGLLQDLTLLRRHEQMVVLASKHHADAPFETYQQLVLQAHSLLITGTFTQEDHLRDALRLAEDDPEAMGTIMTISLTGDIMRMASGGAPPTAEKTRLREEMVSRLVEMAEAGEELKAARASEAAYTIQWLSVVMGRKSLDPQMLLRTLHLDPFRHRTLGQLQALCLAQEDASAACALTRIQLALAPEMDTRRTAAAAATRIGDWAGAHRLLDVCMRERPDDIPLLSQRATTFLRENQSKATLKKAAALYEKIDALVAAGKVELSKDDREILAWNHVLFLTVSGRNEQADSELAAAVKDGVLKENTAKELRELLK